MKNCKIVIGSGYGDEGKGISTDYLARNWAGLVVRFNGGAQAYHTVHNEHGSHVFSHFGSGTLRGIPTYLSKDFIVNPLLFRKEHNELLGKGIVPVVHVHPECYVSTVFDMLINRTMEDLRGDNRHGSVGVGINETVTRDFDRGVRLRVKGLLSNSFMKDKVSLIAKVYIPERLNELGLASKQISDIMNLYDLDKMIVCSLLDIQYFLNTVQIMDDTILGEYDNVLFEGAQGLLLDEFLGVYPYVTRSRTGITNVLPMLNNDTNTDVYYITRAYTTRHGRGPLLAEQAMPEWAVDTTNKRHDYQESMRYAPLDITSLADRIDSDFNQATIPAHKKLIVTCMDQIPVLVDCIEGGVHKQYPKKEFIHAISACTNCSEMLLNYSKITPNKMIKEM